MASHYSEEAKQRARDMRAAGATIRDIALASGAAYNTVLAWCSPETSKNMRAYARRWQRENRDACKVYAARRKKKLADDGRDYHKEWYEKNRASKLTKNREWAEANPKRYWASMTVGTARMRAAKKGVQFDITIDDVVSLYPDDGLCPIFRTPLIIGGGYKDRLNSPSLDRVIPEKGYVRGNIAVISNRANMTKNSASASDLRKIADWMDSFTKGA